jgi:hypothetical protein
MRTLEQLTDAYVALDSRKLSSRDGLLDIRSALSELATKVREFRAEVEAALVENIDLHGDIDMGDGKRLYVGVDRTYKCVNNAATFDALFEATGGDITLMAEHLASSAWKPGSCRKTLADRFDTLFETAEAKDVKTGSAKRIVKAFDPQFGGGA